MVVYLNQKCPNCNNNLKSNVSFCPNCGYHITNNSNNMEESFDFSDDFSFAANNDFSDDFNYESDEVNNNDFDYDDSTDIQLDDFDYEDSENVKLDDFKYDDISENLDLNNQSNEFDDFNNDFTFTSDSNKDGQYFDMDNNDTIDLFEDIPEDKESEANSYTESSQQSQNVYEPDFTSTDFSFGDAALDDAAEESIQDTPDDKNSKDTFDFASSDFSFDDIDSIDADTNNDLSSNEGDESLFDYFGEDNRKDDSTQEIDSNNDFKFITQSSTSEHDDVKKTEDNNLSDFASSDFSFGENEIIDTAGNMVSNDNNQLDEKTTDFISSDFSFDELTEDYSNENGYSYNKAETSSKDITYDEGYKDVGDNSFDEIIDDFSFDEGESAQNNPTPEYSDSIISENDNKSNYGKKFPLETTFDDFEFAEKTNNNNYSDDLLDELDSEYDNGSETSFEHSPRERYDYVDDFGLNNEYVDYDENKSQIMNKYDSSNDSSLIDVILANKTIILIMIIIILLIIIIIDHI